MHEIGKPQRPRRTVLLLGATGTIGRATLPALLERGHRVICFGRTRPGANFEEARVVWREGNVTVPGAVERGLQGQKIDVLVSCLASRTGTPGDAWAIDHRAQLNALEAAKHAGARQVVLLSALCVQKPRLAFQHAKLAFEDALQNSGLDYAIVRPTAFFKSLSGQVGRVRSGRPMLVFGDGRLTACKPISDQDLAAYLADCIDAPERLNRILPIGGPGPAITPLDQAEMLTRLLGHPTRIRRVPVGMLDGVIGALALAGRLSPTLAAKAELARIGRYYATESMLVWNAETRSYDAERTPETGRDRLEDHYARLLSGEETASLGEHAVF
ncbi:MAG: NAD(P)H-binding protein [Pseudomonadota bacterium]